MPSGIRYPRYLVTRFWCQTLCSPHNITGEEQYARRFRAADWPNRTTEYSRTPTIGTVREPFEILAIAHQRVMNHQNLTKCAILNDRWPFSCLLALAVEIDAGRQGLPLC